MLVSWLLPCFGRRAAAGVQRFEPPSSDGLSVRRCDERLRPILRSGSVDAPKGGDVQASKNRQGRARPRSPPGNTPAVRGLSQTAGKSNGAKRPVSQRRAPHNCFRSSWLSQEQSYGTMLRSARTTRRPRLGSATLEGGQPEGGDRGGAAMSSLAAHKSTAGPPKQPSRTPGTTCATSWGRTLEARDAAGRLKSKLV